MGYDSTMDAITDKTPPGWLTDSLERSEAQIEAGHTVALEPVIERLRASIARMKAGRKRAVPKTAHNA